MQKKITVEIDQRLDGCKIENILKRELGFSSSLIGKLKRSDDSIMLNGKEEKAIVRVKCGDILKLTIPSGKSKFTEKTQIPLDILFEDEDIIAVNKPCAMPIHPSGKHRSDTLLNALMYYFKDTDFSAHIITRLDKDTSGVVLIAKNPLSAQILTESMKNREIEKQYIAVLNGTPSKKQLRSVCL